MDILEQLLKVATKISSDKKFLFDIKVFTNIDGYISPEYKPFNTTKECRQYIINGIENGTIKTKEDFYKIFRLKIINCESGEILVYND